MDKTKFDIPNKKLRLTEFNEVPQKLKKFNLK